MEIERKYKIETLPDGYENFPSRMIEQAYLCTDPVVRVRRDGDEYYMTYKSHGLLAREEHNLPLNETAYLHLLEKADGIILSKRRYRIPIEGTALTIELDIFERDYQGLIPTEEEALAFTPPAWFGRDVTFTGEYQNSKLSKGL